MMVYIWLVGRVVSIDFGAKRCGMAISDPLGMIANGLPTVKTRSLLKRLEEVANDPGFEDLVIGLPKRHSGELSDIEKEISAMILKIEELLPQVSIHRFDERFTSKLALQAMIDAGSTKKQRREKGNIDKVSATLILQEYLNLK